MSKLEEIIINSSIANSWQIAVGEWEIISCEKDISGVSPCICEKENIKYLFRLRNICTGKEVFPVGQNCIKKFNRPNLVDETDVYIQKYKLHALLLNDETVDNNIDLFSRKLLFSLYEDGAFENERDYEFMLQTFNRKRIKSEYAHKKATVAVICRQIIKPFLDKTLNYKNNECEVDNNGED